jgi:hypothetical protein
MAQADERLTNALDDEPAASSARTSEEPHSLISIRGAWRGQIHITEDFDELPDDLADALDARQSVRFVASTPSDGICIRS